MGRGPASIRGRTRLAHAIVPMVLRKRACAMPKKVTPIAASAEELRPDDIAARAVIEDALR